MKKLLKGGLVVSSNDAKIMDILIDNDKIIKVSENIEDDEAEIIDVKGKEIYPGFIDAHTHLDLHVAGTVTADDFKSGTRAAVIGGTTLVIDYATQYHGETLKEALKNWDDKASVGCSCDYSYHMSISDWNDDVKDEIDDMIDAGITSFKLYLTYPDMMLDDHDMYQVMKALAKKNCFAGVHCENAGVIDALRERSEKSGHIAEVSEHYKTRPATAEAEAVHRLMFIADVAHAPVMVVHTSCEEALNEIRNARANGQIVFCETCPQYLALDSSKLDNPDFNEASKYICAPALRTKHDQEVLWKAIADGEVNIISTDHCSFDMSQRKMGEGDFRKIPGGLAGIEHRGVILYSEGVSKGRISREKFCEVMSENPSKLYGVYGTKGIIKEGADADLVIIDPNQKYNISVSNSHYNIDYSEFEGMEINCKIDSVYLRGNKVVENNECIMEDTGKFVKRDFRMEL